MPEEVAIAFLALLAIGWVIYKVFQGIATATDSGQKFFRDLIGTTRDKRYRKKRAALLPHVQTVVPNELKHAQQHILAIETDFIKRRQTSAWIVERPRWEELDFRRYSFASQSAASQPLNIGDILSILRPNTQSWSEQEQKLISQQCSYPTVLSVTKIVDFKEFPTPSFSLALARFDVDWDAVSKKAVDTFFARECDAVAAYNEQRDLLLSRCKSLIESIATWNREERGRWQQYRDRCAALAREEAFLLHKHATQYEGICHQQKFELSETLDGFRTRSKLLVIKRTGYILASLRLPASLPRFWNIDYDEAEQILIVEIALPNVVHRHPIKTVAQKTGSVSKPLNQSERKELIPKIHPAIMLRVACEILRNDAFATIKLLVLNGWVDFIDPHNGVDTRAYTASLLLTPEQIETLNLQNVDPLAAFHALKGKSAGKLVEIIPIEPTLNLRRNDARFVDAKAVLDALSVTTNLAAMDWQEFEHLIRELFEREFAVRGAEVKITRASRDRGVDAVAFNPDPIQGGKYIIQAKRYTNTVDVSAVRDLCAVVRKEGASRGILVTTSAYGADAYEFANNEPITLLNGAELLGLLQKHGYTFRIDLAEARRMRAVMSN